MELTKEFAEILGMFAADGCLQDKYVCMWGNIHEDKEYYDNVVCPFFSKVFNKKVVAHEKKSNGVYGFYICDKTVINIFKEMGFIRNKTYTVGAPKIILESNDLEIYSAFIRGFTDCDGCMSFMRRKGKYKEFKRRYNTYPRITIKVMSKKIVQDMGGMLIKLGLHHTITSEKNERLNGGRAHQINVRGKTYVEKWIEQIGLNNSSKMNKYLIWKKHGICPSGINFKQGKEILNGTLNPFGLDAPDRI